MKTKNMDNIKLFEEFNHGEHETRPNSGWTVDSDPKLWARIQNVYHKTTVGIAVIYQKKILMVHPRVRVFKNLAMQIEKDHWTLPKGNREGNETLKATAIREIKEELGININPNQLRGDVFESYYRSNKGFLKGFVIYKLHINNLRQIGMESEKLPQNRMDLSEVTHAEFFTKGQAHYKSDKRMKNIFNRLKF